MLVSRQCEEFKLHTFAIDLSFNIYYYIILLSMYRLLITAIEFSQNNQAAWYSKIIHLFGDIGKIRKDIHLKCSFISSLLVINY